MLKEVFTESLYVFLFITSPFVLEGIAAQIRAIARRKKTKKCTSLKNTHIARY